MPKSDFTTPARPVRRDVQADLRLQLRPNMLGGPKLFFDAVFRALHAANRTAPETEGYAAVFTPGWDPSRPGLQAWGDVLRLVGSEPIITRTLQDERAKQVLDAHSVYLVDPTDPVPCAAYALRRDRSVEKASPGRLRRDIRRAERNGRSTAALKAKLGALDGAPEAALAPFLTVDMVKHPLRMVLEPVDVPTTQAMVTSYGLSLGIAGHESSAVAAFSLDPGASAKVEEADPYAEFLNA